ncbi:hypothetical protein BpHYR1_036995 [Brachionus plicatilis]|uniref:Uncharacterized protein n=1 Tax=Brachionus plicatilis TaxID=10195 RepID=A0A3M7SXH2_BRAPC|nr:hypothetical protein BpHYR1_036995 [Brachionus plicatilis]
MTKNCDMKEAFEPNEINWDYNQFKLTNFTKKVLHFGKHSSLNFKDMTDFLSEYSHIDLLVIKSYYFFSKFLLDKPDFKIAIEKMGFGPHEFELAFQFKNWYQKLFRLNKKLQERYESTLRKLKPIKNTNLICAQVRIGDPGHIG